MNAKDSPPTSDLIQVPPGSLPLPDPPKLSQPEALRKCAREAKARRAAAPEPELTMAEKAKAREEFDDWFHKEELADAAERGRAFAKKARQEAEARAKEPEEPDLLTSIRQMRKKQEEIAETEYRAAKEAEPDLVYRPIRGGTLLARLLLVSGATAILGIILASFGLKEPVVFVTCYAVTFVVAVVIISCTNWFEHD